jgi:protein-S-isoprenylcysteine O-methyltransferase Ste14
MSQNGSEEMSVVTARRSLWAMSAFYVLIAFEFFYMATPFAAFFYGVYGPGLDWLEGSALTRWSIQFFLPHLVEQTRSPLINVHEVIGALLLFGGLLGFALGAFQVYRAKLRRNNAVMGGLYRYIRHPQYLALITASIGMLLIWPRFLVLIGTITVTFIYVALAKAEEGICLRQYPDYQEYLTKTGMFLPRPLVPQFGLGLGGGRFVRIGIWVGAYVGTVLLAVLVAVGIRDFTIGQLYTRTTSDSVYLAVTRMTDAELAEVVRIASEQPAVVATLSAAGPGARFLNYVLPTEMYVSEIPMQLPAGARFGHSIPEDYDREKFKVIFTVAEFGGEEPPDAAGILRHAVNKFPLVEVHLDLGTGSLVKSLPPPDMAFYGGRQVPLF